MCLKTSYIMCFSNWRAVYFFILINYNLLFLLWLMLYMLCFRNHYQPTVTVVPLLHVLKVVWLTPLHEVSYWSYIIFLHCMDQGFSPYIAVLCIEKIFFPQKTYLTSFFNNHINMILLWILDCFAYIDLFVFMVIGLFSLV